MNSNNNIECNLRKSHDQLEDIGLSLDVTKKFSQIKDVSKAKKLKNEILENDCELVSDSPPIKGSKPRDFHIIPGLKKYI